MAQIRAKTVGLAIGCVIVTAVSLGIVANSAEEAVLVGERRRELQRELEIEGVRLESMVREARQDCLVLSRLPAVSCLLNLGSLDDERRTESDVASLLSGLIRAKPYYDQARVIAADSRGSERVRVNRLDGQPVVVDRDRLQSKVHRPYVRDALNLGDGECLVSRVTLNQENGRIVEPWEPMLRVACRVASPDRETLGIIVLNIRFDRMIESMLELHPLQYEYFVCNETGDYLYHANRVWTFGFEFGRPRRLYDDFPDATLDSRAMPASASGNPALRLVSVGSREAGRDLILGVTSDPDAIPTTSRNTIAMAWCVGLVIIALTSAIAFGIASKWTRPLQDIVGAANAVSAGDAEVVLPVDREDEIGAVAKSLDTMLRTLRCEQMELELANNELRRKNEELENFAHIASHELREPVRRMRLVADMILENESATISDGSRDLIALLHETGCRAQELMDGLRTLARLGQETLSTESVALDHVMATSVSAFAERAPGIVVRTTATPRVRGSSVLIETVFCNLLDNAVKYGDIEDPQIHVNTSESDGICEVRISNAGEPIPASRLGDVVKPFVRLSARQPGMGLGLAICSKIVAAHGGTFCVDSNVQRTTVTFTLPCS